MSVKEIVAFNPPSAWVRQQIEKAGSKIGGVWFYKRSNGELRKMCYKLHCKNPTAAKKPNGIALKDDKSLLPSHSVVMDGHKAVVRFSKRIVDRAHNLITILSTNDMSRDKTGQIIGRGAYKSIPLDRVTRIVNNGVVTTIERDWKK